MIYSRPTHIISELLCYNAVNPITNTWSIASNAWHNSSGQVNEEIDNGKPVRKPGAQSQEPKAHSCYGSLGRRNSKCRCVFAGKSVGASKRSLANSSKSMASEWLTPAPYLCTYLILAIASSIALQRFLSGL